jgi:hypothetical protein
MVNGDFNSKKIIPAFLVILFSSILNPLRITAQIASTDSIISIKHGVSFGMCDDYCFHETTYTRNAAIAFSKSWTNEEKGKYPDKFDSLKFNVKKWRELIQSLDLPEFYSLSQRIGYPDCADGGAEWIEVQTLTKIYKVEFEFGSKIEILDKILKLLREKH